jgi:di/tripeptidase
MCVQVGASVEQDTAYPGWAPNPGSAVVGLAKEVLEEVTGHTVKVPLLMLSCLPGRLPGRE